MVKTSIEYICFCGYRTMSEAEARLHIDTKMRVDPDGQEHAMTAHGNLQYVKED